MPSCNATVGENLPPCTDALRAPNHPARESLVEIADIYCLMRRLGITANYTGYFHASHAVMLSAREPERLLLITKWVYPDVAKHYRTTWRSVERNIRTVSRLAWETNRPELERMAQHPLPARPSAGVFLAILAAQAQQEHTAGSTALPEK